MSKQEFLDELESLSDRAEQDGNTREVVAGAAVLIALRASLKECKTVEFMDHALIWTEAQANRLGARRN